MDNSANRRQHPRRVALFNAMYTVESGTYRDRIGNVSAGGIFIHTTREVKTGQKIDLRFPIVAFDQRSAVAGTVVRTQDGGFAVMFDHPIAERLPWYGDFERSLSPGY